MMIIRQTIMVDNHVVCMIITRRIIMLNQGIHQVEALIETIIVPIRFYVTRMAIPEFSEDNILI